MVGLAPTVVPGLAVIFVGFYFFPQMKAVACGVSPRFFAAAE
ncbi:MAG: hypothetical protein AB7W37_12830 [Syntrophobacteraceae bacterium]